MGVVTISCTAFFFLATWQSAEQHGQSQLSLNQLAALIDYVQNEALLNN